MPPLNSSVKPHSEVFPAQMAVTGITMAPSERRASVESEASTTDPGGARNARRSAQALGLEATADHSSYSFLPFVNHGMRFFARMYL